MGQKETVQGGVGRITYEQTGTDELASLARRHPFHTPVLSVALFWSIYTSTMVY